MHKWIDDACRPTSVALMIHKERVFTNAGCLQLLKYALATLVIDQLRIVSYACCYSRNRRTVSRVARDNTLTTCYTTYFCLVIAQIENISRLYTCLCLSDMLHRQASAPSSTILFKQHFSEWIITVCANIVYLLKKLNRLNQTFRSESDCQNRCSVSANNRLILRVKHETDPTDETFMRLGLLAKRKQWYKNHALESDQPFCRKSFKR